MPQRGSLSTLLSLPRGWTRFAVTWHFLAWLWGSEVINCVLVPNLCPGLKKEAISVALSLFPLPANLVCIFGGHYGRKYFLLLPSDRFLMVLAWDVWSSIFSYLIFVSRSLFSSNLLPAPLVFALGLGEVTAFPPSSSVSWLWFIMDKGLCVCLCISCSKG